MSPEPGSQERNRRNSSGTGCGDFGRSPEESLRLGWAHGALLTTFPGDVTMAKLPEVEALATGGSARVQR